MLSAIERSEASPPCKRVHSLMDLVSVLACRKSCRLEDFWSVEEWLEILEVQEVKFECPLKECGKRYKHRWGLLEHVRMRHNPFGTPKYECNECGKRYSRMDGLKVHHKGDGHQGVKTIVEEPQRVDYPPEIHELVRLSQGEKPEPPEDTNSLRFHCNSPTCHKSYASKYRCIQHQLRAHGTPRPERPFPCDYPDCNKAYSNKDGLTRHRKATGHKGQDNQERSKEAEKPLEEEKKPGKEELDVRVKELVAFFDEI